MALAFRKIWGNFVTTNNPSISTEEANGASSNSTSANDASDWIPYSADEPYQLNLNQVRPFYIANDHTIPATPAEANNTIVSNRNADRRHTYDIHGLDRSRSRLSSERKPRASERHLASRCLEMGGRERISLRILAERWADRTGMRRAIVELACSINALLTLWYVLSK